MTEKQFKTFCSQISMLAESLKVISGILYDLQDDSMDDDQEVSQQKEDYTWSVIRGLRGEVYQIDLIQQITAKSDLKTMCLNEPDQQLKGCEECPKS